MSSPDRQPAGDVPAVEQGGLGSRTGHRIDDAGERFSGARKYDPRTDLAGAGANRGDILRLAQLWPRPDFRADALAARTTPGRAALYQSVYANLRPAAFRPKAASWGPAERWSDWYRIGVAFLRQAYESGLHASLETLREAYTQYMEALEPGTPAKERRAAYALGHGTSRSLRSPLRLTWSLEVRADCLAELGWPNDPRVEDKEPYGVKYLAYEGKDVHRTGWYTVRTRGKAVRFIDPNPYPNRATAMHQIQAHFAKVLADRARESTKRVKATHPSRPRLDRPPERTGPDWRRGRVISTDDMLQHFRFRGIEFGKWLTQAERQGLLDTTYDALSDLCDLFGLPASFASLGGRLGIAFGSRGRGFLSGAAHFEPKSWIMHLTKTSGTGAIAHEFGHALDAYLHWRNWPTSVPGTTSTYFSSVFWTHRRPTAAGMSLRDAFLEEPAGRLWDAIAGRGRDSRFLVEARHLDAKPGVRIARKKVYWTRPTELFARCFEAWVSDRLEDQDRKNEFLAQGCERDVDPKCWGLTHDPYPQGQERVEILEGMDGLIGTAATRWRAQAAARRQ